MSNIKNVITHLYKADVEVPVSVTVDYARDDYVYAEKTFNNLSSANAYITDKDYDDEVSELVAEKKQEVCDDIYDDVDVSYDSSDEAKTEVKAISVNDLSIYEVREFLKSNPTYVVASQKIITSYSDRNQGTISDPQQDDAVHTSTEIKRIFVDVKQDEIGTEVEEMSADATPEQIRQSIESECA